MRVNDRFQIDDPAFADRLWNDTALRELVSGLGAAASEEERDKLWGGKVVSKTYGRHETCQDSPIALKDWLESQYTHLQIHQGSILCAAL